MEVQDLIKREHIHQTSPFPKPRVRNPIAGPLKANVVQSVEDNMNWSEMTKDQIIIALVKHAQKRVVPFARTRFNTIPDESQEVATPRSRLLGAYPIRGCGITKTTFRP
eukprot:12922183-Prorocentrum_lima.AAC.1